MKKRFSYLYFLIVLVAGIIVACSGEDEKIPAKENEIATEPGEDTTSREFGYFERSAKHPFTNEMLSAYNRMRKKAKYPEYFVKTYSGTFFMLLTKPMTYGEKGLNPKKTRFGLGDSKGNILLPMEYDRIGNPGMIADDYMEICQNGKYGLYNYASKTVIKPEYDLIYPSNIMEYVAIGQKGSKLYKIYPDGTSKAFPAEQNAPSYQQLLKRYRYNSESDYYGLWTETQQFKELDLNAEFYAYGSAIIVTPSYLTRLPFMPDYCASVSPIWNDEGGDSLDISIQKNQEHGDNVAIITSFYEMTAAARGSITHSNYLTTVSKKNTVKASRKLFSYDDYFLMNVCSENTAIPKVRFLNDSLVEVKNYKENNSLGIPYQWYTCFEYYSIGRDGSIKELGSGIFPMTAAIALNKTHFKGCFSRGMEEDEIMHTEIYDEDMGGIPIYAYTDHLTAEDLAYMRNEIYARHGMKFKDPAITEQFREFKWYKPKYTNVDKFLSEIEQKNLRLIKELERDLRAKPEAYIHEEQRYMVVAG